VPSVLRRTAGFDVPDFLAAGPRDVMVSEGDAAAARATLGESEVVPSEGDQVPFGSRAARLVAGVLIIGLVGLLCVWALFQATA
jgi:hypothetical protein